MTFSLEQAYELKAKVEETGLVLALTHTYSGYPAVKDAKARIARGDLGQIRKVYVEYTQGWLSKRIELEGGNNAGWRTDPKRSGKAGAMGDIGTHAWHLAEYMTGLKVTEMSAELKAYAPGRPIDDDGAALLRLENGVTGVLVATQVAAGEANNIRIRVYGENGGIEWRQMDPNILLLKWSDRPTEIIDVGCNAQMAPEAIYNTRTPGGHPEGYLEAFANIYRNFANTVQAKIAGEQPDPYWADFPNVDDGVRGMQFIETIVKAGWSDDAKWVKWVE
jgi:predicted dehydrogenase